jgi:hypothetical protein
VANLPVVSESCCRTQAAVATVQARQEGESAASDSTEMPILRFGRSGARILPTIPRFGPSKQPIGPRMERLEDHMRLDRVAMSRGGGSKHPDEMTIRRPELSKRADDGFRAGRRTPQALVNQ